ncbi:efflux transporter outer membrane subunit OpmH [Kistimonas scapharcae]|uniref:Efflux transporter outer membrane subunit OpmH n=1 Tax=Kistimonas scapharcae TaxID=1036133 RepID=A0ABP8VAE9_9GAMM
MVSKRFLSLLSGTLLTCAMTVQAEQPMDLLEIYDLALKNDAQLAAARASWKASTEVVPQGRAALLPNISMSANTADNRSSQLVSTPLSNVGGAGDRTNNWNSHGWSATLRQPLFNLESWFNFERAEALSEQARIQFSVEQQNLIMRVSEAYFNVLRAQDNLATAKAEEKAVKRQLDQTRQRFEVGLIAETDVYEAKAAYDAARVTRIQGTNDVEVALENLTTITNVGVPAIAQMDKRMPVNTPVPAIAQEWVNTAIAQNLTLEAARKGVNVAEEQLRVSKSGHAPTLNAVATYSHINDPSTANATLGWNGKSNNTVYGLELSMPIFSGGATSSKVRESGYRLEESQQTVDLTLRQTTTNARNLYRTVNTDVDRIEARCQGIVSARSALKATESGYEVGTRNIVDVLNAQQVLYSAQRDYFNARYDFIINTLKLKQTAGTLSPEDLQALNEWMTGNPEEGMTVPVCTG